MPYIRRILDDELDELLAGLAAVALEGPKAVARQPPPCSVRARCIVWMILPR